MNGPGPLIKITIEGFKGVAQFVAEPNGHSFVVKGDNGTGKSSTCDAAAWAFGEDVAGKIIRNGSDGAVVDIEWNDGDAKYDIHTATNSKGARVMRVKEGKDTKGAPGSLLARLMGSLGRRTFTTMPATEQVKVVKSLAPGLDTSDLDARRTALYNARHALGQVGASLKGQLDGMIVGDAPSEPGEERQSVDAVDVDNLHAKRADAATQKAGNDRARDGAQKARGEATRAQVETDALHEQIETLMERYKSQQQRADQFAVAADVAEQNAAALVDPDTTVIDQEIAAAREKNRAARAETETHNRTVRAAQQAVTAHAVAVKAREEMAARVKAERDKYAAHTKEIDAIDAEKIARIAAAASALPVEGLAIVGGAVMLDDGTHGPVEARVGVLNDAACIELDLRMAHAQGHRVVRVPNAERLGKAARAKVDALADGFGIQMIYEVVADGAPLTAEIVDRQQ